MFQTLIDGLVLITAIHIAECGDANGLIQKLASSLPEPKVIDGQGLTFPEGVDSSRYLADRERVARIISALIDCEANAFPHLVEHEKDSRFSVLEAPISGRHQSRTTVGTLCGEILKSQIDHVQFRLLRPKTQNLKLSASYYIHLRQEARQRGFDSIIPLIKDKELWSLHVDALNFAIQLEEAQGFKNETERNAVIQRLTEVRDRIASTKKTSRGSREIRVE
jgi:hypothetical protein